MKISIADDFSAEDEDKAHDKDFRLGEAVSIPKLAIALDAAKSLSLQLRAHGHWERVELFKCRFKGGPEAARISITIVLKIPLNSDYCKGSVSREVFSNWIDLKGMTGQRVAEDLLGKIKVALNKIGVDLYDKGSELRAST
jgi:hypothetical protein